MLGYLLFNFHTLWNNEAKYKLIYANNTKIIQKPVSPEDNAMCHRPSQNEAKLPH